jgi:hypothetical protein
VFFVFIGRSGQIAQYFLNASADKERIGDVLGGFVNVEDAFEKAREQAGRPDLLALLDGMTVELKNLIDPSLTPDQLAFVERMFLQVWEGDKHFAEQLTVENRARIDGLFRLVVSHFTSCLLGQYAALGIEPSAAGVRKLLNAWRAVGLPTEYFMGAKFDEHADAFKAYTIMLETKARVLDRIKDVPKMGDVVSLRRVAGLVGRPPQPKLNVQVFETLCGEAGLNVEKQWYMASALGVSVDTIHRGLAGQGWSDATFDNVAEGLSKILNREINPEELKRK